MTRLHADERGIVASFVIRLVLGLALVGLIAIEGGTILWTKLKAQDAAEAAAIAAADSYMNNQDEEVATEAAVATVARKDDEARLIVPLTIDRDGTVHVMVVKKATTIILGHIDFLKDLTVARATATGSPAQPGF